jgi:hypothetical protein
VTQVADIPDPDEVIAFRISQGISTTRCLASISQTMKHAVPPAGVIPGYPGLEVGSRFLPPGIVAEIQMRRPGTEVFTFLTHGAPLSYFVSKNTKPRF